MASNSTVFYTRLTHADKLPDRFLTTQVYSPADPEAQNKGMIFSQIEILNPWFPTSQIGQTIINTIIREYYRGNDTSDLVNLESALKRVNETLAQVTQSGETDWIGNLHGVLILINGKDIHFSQTGRTQAYLFRSGRINHITEGLDSENEPHPLRTFSNITSGTLEDNDKIVIANPAFFKVVDLDTAKEIVNQYPPSLAAQEFAKILKMNKAHAGEALVLSLMNKRDYEALPVEEKFDTVYMDAGGVGSVLHSVRGAFNFSNSAGLKKFGAGVKDTLRRADEGFDKYVSPHIKRAGSATASAAKSGTDKIVNKMTHGKGIDPNSATGRVIEFFKNIGRAIAAGFNKITGKIGFSQQLSPERRARNYGIWGAALIIVLIFLVFITIKFQSNTPTKVAPNALQKETTELSDKFNKIKLLAAYNNRTEALKEINAIYKDLTKLSQKYELPSSLVELRKQVIDELGNITSTKVLANVDKVAQWGDKPFIAGGKDTALAIDNSKATTLPDAKDIDLSSFNGVTGAAVDPDSGATFIGTEKGMKKIEGTSAKNVALSAGVWTKSSIFKIFDSNIYAVDKSSKKILKYTHLKDKYSEAEDYSSPEGDELSKAVGVAVNGSVLVLLDDSSIIKYTKSARTKINYSDLPDSNFIYKSMGIYASGDKSTIVIVHKDYWANDLTRVTILTRTGKYKKSYFLPIDSANVKSLDYDAKNSKLWFVTNNAIYKASVEE